MISNKTGVHWYSLSGVQCAWMHSSNARIRSYTSEVSASFTCQNPKHPLIFELPTILLSFQFSSCALYCHVQALQFALQALSELNLMISKVKYSRLPSDDDSHTPCWRFREPRTYSLSRDELKSGVSAPVGQSCPHDTVLVARRIGHSLGIFFLNHGLILID